MDAAAVVQSATTSKTPPPLEPGLLVTWPRCVQITLGVLLGIVLVSLISQAVLSSWDSPPASQLPDRLDLNGASQAELLLLPGIGPNLAERILTYRQEKGPFQKVEELRRVSGIGPVTLERLRPLVCVAEKGFGPAPILAQEKKASVMVAPTRKFAAQPKKGTSLAAPIDLNSASLSDLQKLPGIGPKLSQRILDERAKKPFQSVDDLRRVRGIGKKTVEKVRPFAKVASTVVAANP